MRWSSALVLGLVQLCLASPHAKRWGDMVEKHSWTQIPTGWEYHSAPSPEQLLELRLGLKPHKMDELISTLYEVSDPAHERYGKHLSKEEADAFIAPHPKAVESVEDWLQHHGIDPSEVTHRSDAGDWVTVRVSVAQAEKMLGTKYGVYHHAKSSDYVVRTLRYSLPRDLHSHVDIVTPTTYFGTFRSMKATSFIQPEITPLELDVDTESLKVGEALSPDAVPPTSCNTVITPACLRTLYNTANYTPKATAQNSIGLAGYLEEFGNRADLQTFYNRFLPNAAGSSYTTVRVNNGQDDQSDPGVEANLDIQYAFSVAFPTPGVYYSTAGRPPFVADSQTPTNTNEPYLDWVNFVLSQSTIPQTISTSYGDDEQTVPADYRTSVCNQLAVLGARGTTVLFSSGDFGVGGGDCLTNDGTRRKLFQPAFPASCPFVTTVGGTIRTNPEVAVSFSGGGFSRAFPRPAFQDAAVSAYLNAIGNTNSGLFNASGRAYPDLAAQGQGFQVVIGGRVSSVGGTSASSPVSLRSPLFQIACSSSLTISDCCCHCCAPQRCSAGCRQAHAWMA
ncbi:hypothetical protein HGRIS_004065 [Hohenbuehelia grisea]|uniref:Peptidase S53 domain-containing protein n=1 Tax=Hohenbuehelia grisea TaxID=104357 RepID=A0ABR3JHC4_9AGAR